MGKQWRLQSHGHATVAALAKQLYESWRAAADAEAQRRARARALALPASGVDALGADPTRQAAVCLLGEALRTAAREAAAAADGELAMAIEAAVHRAHGGGTKAYRGRLRLLASVLRAPRGGLRERLRLGEVGAAAFAAMASFDDVLQSDGDREKKKQRQEKERRAIDSLRIANQGSASSEHMRVVRIAPVHALPHELARRGAPHVGARHDRPVPRLRAPLHGLVRQSRSKHRVTVTRSPRARVEK